MKTQMVSEAMDIRAMAIQITVTIELLTTEVQTI
jgi:hypothetical protein